MRAAGVGAAAWSGDEREVPSPKRARLGAGPDAAAPVLVLWDDVMLQHADASGRSPERPERLSLILSALRAAASGRGAAPLAGAFAAGEIVLRSPSSATFEEVAAVHGRSVHGHLFAQVMRPAGPPPGAESDIYNGGPQSASAVLCVTM